MIPLRDNNPRRTVPVVTYSLIALNALAFFWQLSLGSNLERALFQIAFIPARFWLPGNWVADAFTIVSSMFLHGSLMHIGSNMLYLFIFGDNIEDRLGKPRYILLSSPAGSSRRTRTRSSAPPRAYRPSAHRAPSPESSAPI